jgi:hypothetical protein
MKIALLLAAVASLSFAQDVPTATFTEPFAGFQFTYPKTWTLAKATKKKDSWHTIFSIPIEGSDTKGELDVDRTEYHASIDLWQTIQLRANEQLHREVVRQWTQEVLGVSMLFSRIDYTEQGVPMTSVSGLYFTKTNQKLFLRLTSRASDFDKLFYEFGKVLETLRQLDGKLPEEDDPTKELAPAPKKPELADISFHAIESAKTAKTAYFKAPTTADIVVSTRKIVFRMPTGWAPDKVKGNTLELTEPTLSSRLHVEFFSLLDSDPAQVALTKLAASHLDQFTKVANRTDVGPNTNKGGCSVALVWRVGESTKGPLMTCDAMGTMGGYYFLMSYSQTDEVQYKADRKLIELLLKQVSIELAP